MIYAWRYPKSIHRSVMIGVNPPGHFLWDPKTTDEQIRPLLRALREGRELQRADGRPRRDDAADGRRHPDRWWFLPIKEGNVRIASFFGLMESTSEAAPLRRR